MSEEVKEMPQMLEAEQAMPMKKFRKQPKKRVCIFCEDKIESIDYKDVARLRKFITEKGKILPHRQTGTCSKHQRELATAIKRARYMALIPYVGE